MQDKIRHGELSWTRPRSATYHFYSHFTGQNLVIGFYLMAEKRIKKSSVLEDEDNKDTGDHFQSLTQKAKVRYHSMLQYRIKNRDMRIFKFSLFSKIMYYTPSFFLFLLLKAGSYLYLLNILST